MEPGRTARHDLQRLRRRTSRRQHGERIGLGVEGIDFAIAFAPMAPDARRLCQRAAHAGGGRELIRRRVAAKHLADFEQADIGKTAIGVPLRRRDQARDKARPHVGEIGRDRIGERQLRLAAAEQVRLLLLDERPSHRFDQIARAERALGFAGAQLDRREHRLARRFAAVERRRRHAVHADDAHDFLDDVGFALHIGAPRRHRGLDAFALAGRPRSRGFQARGAFPAAARRSP